MTTPGFYPDPSGSSGERYWDGRQWTDQVRAIPEAGARQAPPRFMAQSRQGSAQGLTEVEVGAAATYEEPPVAGAKELRPSRIGVLLPVLLVAILAAVVGGVALSNRGGDNDTSRETATFGTEQASGSATNEPTGQAQVPPGSSQSRQNGGFDPAVCQEVLDVEQPLFDREWGDDSTAYGQVQNIVWGEKAVSLTARVWRNHASWEYARASGMLTRMAEVLDEGARRYSAIDTAQDRDLWTMLLMR